MNLVLLLSLSIVLLPPAVIVPEQVPDLVSNRAGRVSWLGSRGATFKSLWDQPTSSTLGPFVPSTEPGLCPQTVSNSSWMGGLGHLLSPVPTAWASLRFSGSKADPVQILQSYQISVFLMGRKARTQKQATLEQNSIPKTLWVIPVGGDRQPAPGGCACC